MVELIDKKVVLNYAVRMPKPPQYTGERTEVILLGPIPDRMEFTYPLYLL